MARWIGVNEEVVVLGALAIAPAGLRLGEAGADYRRFEVVGYHALWHPTKEAEGVLVAEQPGGLALVKDQLSIEVAAEGEHHDEDPGLAHGAAAGIHAQPGIAEVDLRLAARRDLD